MIVSTEIIRDFSVGTKEEALVQPNLAVGWHESTCLIENTRFFSIPYHCSALHEANPRIPQTVKITAGMQAKDLLYKVCKRSGLEIADHYLHLKSKDSEVRRHLGHTA